MNRRTQQEMGRRFFLLIAVCWLILLAIMGLRIYLTSELSGNNAELYSRIQELETQNANLTRDNKNLADQLGNLTQAYNVSESNNKDLSAGVQELNTRNQELETEKKNLKQQIQDMTTNWNELNVSRAQWSIDSYCLGNTDKKCQACQKGWNLTQPSCYAYNNAQPPNRKTWEEARDDCKGMNSVLVVAHDSEEKVNPLI
ncbi:C-type lectin domain family 12 member B-like [Trematomus bernacchii]|uniref:C-type lectin domain family 12 member B-like n=1 Tax=Trematomus bernacchii TaxID=40690 RepID=UPI00146CE2C7|nr:C-type lectin domain family 12 member B-like [Trematomus bernacchii]